MCIRTILEEVEVMPKIAITCGDPAGIGPEIIKDWWDKHEAKRKNIVIIGPKNWLDSFDGAEKSQLVSVDNPNFELTPGNPSKESSQIAIEALKLAATGNYQTVVTGPINKEWAQKGGFKYPGQTEFFAATWGGDPVMGFVGKRMIVTLATWHIPFTEVPNKLNPEVLLRTIQETDKLLRLLGKPTQRIGVCGLNPHAGEAGLLGYEEQEWIDPFLDEARKTLPGLSTTLSADTAFYRHLQGEFDAIIALYHDQGLAPLKTIEFDSAVNVTLGLSKIRTSPDHGTAYAIAGKGIANSNSLSRAIDLAENLSNIIASNL